MARDDRSGSKYGSRQQNDQGKASHETMARLQRTKQAPRAAHSDVNLLDLCAGSPVLLIVGTQRPDLKS